MGMAGHKKDTSKLFMRGIMIFGLQEDIISWCRLYVQPVEVSGKGIEAAEEELMHGKKNT